jgi:tape measure domain-containing protein
MAKTQRVIRYIEVKADTKDFIDQLNKIDKSTAAAAAELTKLNKATASVERSAKATASSLARFEASVAKASRAIKGFGIIFLVTQLYRAAEAAVRFAVSMAQATEQLTLMQTRLSRLGTGAGASNLSRTADLADKLGLSLADAADNVGLLSPAFERVGGTFGQVATFAENLTQSLRVFGTDARRAQIVTVQLAQALGSGNLAGDELRSLNENAGGLGLQLEKAVQEILNTTDGIKELGSAGKLTSEVVMKAFDKVFKNLEKSINALPPLLSQAAKRFENAWTNAISAIDKKLGATEFLTRFLEGATATLEINTVANAPDLATVAAAPSSVRSEAFSQAQIQLDQLIPKVQQLQAELDVAREKGGRSSNQIIKNNTRELKVLEEQIALLQKTQALIISVEFDYSRSQIQDTIAKARADAEAAMNKPYGAAAVSFFDENNFTGYDEIIDRIGKVIKLTKEGEKNLRDFLPFIIQSAKEAGVAVETMISKFSFESGNFTNFDAGKKSSAKGPAQIIEGTAKDLAEKYKLSYDLIRNGADGWVENIKAGTLYFAEKMKEANGDVKEAVARYYLGSGKVDKYGMDYTTGNNGGLTGTKYANMQYERSIKLMEALGKETMMVGAIQEGIDKQREQAFRDREAEQERLLKLRERAMSEEEVFAAKMKSLQADLDSGAITPDVYAANLLKDMKPVVAFYEDINEQQKKLDDAVRDSAQAWAEWLEQFEEISPEVEKLREGYRMLIADLDEEVITPDEFVRRAEQLRKAVGESLTEVDKLSQAIGGELTSAFGSWIDSAIDGTFNLRDALVDLLKEITKVMLQLALINTLKANGLGGFFGVSGNAASVTATVDSLNKLASPRAIRVDVPEEVSVRAVMEPTPFSVTPEINMPTVDPVVFSAIPDVAPMSGLPDSVHVKAIMEPTEITPPPVTPTFEAPKDIHIATILDPVRVSPMPQAVHINAVLDPVQVAPLPAAMMPRMVAAPAPEAYSGPSTFAMPSADAVRSGYLRTPTTVPMATMDTTAMAEAFAKSGATTSAPPVTVNITESSDKQKQGSVSQRQGQGGESIIDIVVAQVKSSMNSDIARGRGVAAALEAQYGLSRIPGAF